MQADAGLVWLIGFSATVKSPARLKEGNECLNVLTVAPAAESIRCSGSTTACLLGWRLWHLRLCSLKPSNSVAQVKDVDVKNPSQLGSLCRRTSLPPVLPHSQCSIQILNPSLRMHLMLPEDNCYN